MPPPDYEELVVELEEEKPKKIKEKTFNQYGNEMVDRTTESENYLLWLDTLSELQKKIVKTKLTMVQRCQPQFSLVKQQNIVMKSFPGF